MSCSFFWSWSQYPWSWQCLGLGPELGLDTPGLRNELFSVEEVWDNIATQP